MEPVLNAPSAVAVLLEDWGRATEQLRHDVHADVLWQRDSDVNMLLEHLAVREEAIGQVVRRLERLDSTRRASSTATAPTDAS